MSKLIFWLKQETVLIVSGVLAFLSMFFIAPDVQYVKYIDFRVLALLMCLMLVVLGFQETGFFEQMGDALCRKVKTTRGLCMVFVLLCFFSSMLITNDVALITFVPFAMISFNQQKKQHLLILVLVLETIAANLGSMLTPIGNPQNLYLYTKGQWSLGGFVKIMAPYSLVSFVALFLCLFFVAKEPLQQMREEQRHKVWYQQKIFYVYVVFFLLCLSNVFHILDYKVMFF